MAGFVLDSYAVLALLTDDVGGATFRPSNAGPTFQALDHVLSMMLTRWHHRPHRRKVRYRTDSRAFWDTWAWSFRPASYGRTARGAECLR
jgi:hypothetical protein